MTERCARCNHDRRSHHRVGGCCEKIPPYVGVVKDCSCPQFALTKGEVYGTL